MSKTGKRAAHLLILDELEEVVPKATQACGREPVRGSTGPLLQTAAWDEVVRRLCVILVQLENFSYHQRSRARGRLLRLSEGCVMNSMTEAILKGFADRLVE